jgi:threonine dehydrogenase-like Zn-dependent dehydrogenase
MTEYVAVRWQDIHTSERLSLQELALVEPLTVGFHAVERGRTTAEDTVAVIGCGIVGMGAVAAAAQRGARVIAVDIDDDKIALARQAGAAEGFNSTRMDLHQGLSHLTHGYGPEVVIEAVGNPTTFRAAVDEVAYTGRVVYIGYAKTPVEYNSALFVQKELEIYGSRNSVDNFGDVISMLENGSFPSEQVISEVVPLEEAGDALARWSKEPGRFTKIMVSLDDE